MTRKQWENLIRKWERLSGTTVGSFDPSISGYDNGCMNASYQIPVWLIERLLEKMKMTAAQKTTGSQRERRGLADFIRLRDYSSIIRVMPMLSSGCSRSVHPAAGWPGSTRGYVSSLNSAGQGH